MPLSKFTAVRAFDTLRMLVITGALLACAALPAIGRAAATSTVEASAQAPLQGAAAATLGAALRVGDVVFIRVGAKPFREVAAATGSWTNHVGVVVDTSGAEPLIGESKFPLSRLTPWSAFVARSEGGRVAISRLQAELTAEQRLQVAAAADRRAGILYDTGFDLHSRRQFCSRYVREVLAEATGTKVGEVETFAHLLASRPDANVGFWKAWYLGSIPWQRETVTPASVLHSPALRPVFDGIVRQAEPLHAALQGG